MINSSDKEALEQMEDACDVKIARDAYNEYIKSGRKSRPITELWEELNMGYAATPHIAPKDYLSLFNRNFKTSPLEELRELDDGSLEIVTMRSVYRFEPAEIKPPVYQDDADLIELYLCDTNSQFAAGFYYDEEKQPHPLIGSVHLGTFQDSVMVCLAEEPGICTCRFFPNGHTIEFYNTLYGQQDYSRRILIHNTAKIPLEIQFEGFRATWTILPGESKTITPFYADGADHGSTEP